MEDHIYIDKGADEFDGNLDRNYVKMPIIMFREGTREADRLLEEHKGAEAEAKKLKAGMDSSVGICILEGVFRILEGVLRILEGVFRILEGVFRRIFGV